MKYPKTEFKTKRPAKILVMPDAHVEHGQDLKRFEWFKNLEKEIQPDFTVCLGDFADMKSLCSYDKGKKEFEGRRYKKDVEATHKALDVLGPGNGTTNRIMLIGNHEHRIVKACSLQPELDGVLSIDDLGYKSYGWQQYDFKVPVEINGVTFCHYLPSGIMGYAISGNNAASSILAKHFTSAVVGHSHLFDYSERTDPYGNRKIAMAAGCFFEHDEEYAGPANRMYRRGVAVLHRVHNGEFDVEWVSINRLKEEYNGS